MAKFGGKDDTMTKEMDKMLEQTGAKKMLNTIEESWNAMV